MTKIFDDYDVDCNECTHYWDSSCDGVPIEQKRNCTSYKATRTTDIPMQIKKLDKRLDKLRLIAIGLLILDIVLGVMLLK